MHFEFTVLHSLLWLWFYLQEETCKTALELFQISFLKGAWDCTAQSIPSSAASTWTVTLSACGALTSGHRAIFGDEKLQMNDPMLGILQICMRHILLECFLSESQHQIQMSSISFGDGLMDVCHTGNFTYGLLLIILPSFHQQY